MHRHSPLNEVDPICHIIASVGRMCCLACLCPCTHPALRQRGATCSLPKVALWHVSLSPSSHVTSLVAACTRPCPPQIRAEVERLGVAEGFVNVLSRHTTTAIAINEAEDRLLDDIRQVRPCNRELPAGLQAPSQLA